MAQFVTAWGSCMGQTVTIFEDIRVTFLFDSFFVLNFYILTLYGQYEIFPPNEVRAFQEMEDYE